MKIFVTLAAVISGGTAHYLTIKYSSWKSQYIAELKKLGYEKQDTPEPVGTLGVFRKDNELLVLHIISEGVVATKLDSPDLLK